MRFLVVAVMIAATPVSAQTVVDGSDPGLDEGTLKNALERITDQLVDPVSAQLRKLSLGSALKLRTLCGEINAKNGFGGYVGFRPFYSTIDANPEAIIRDPNNPGYFDDDAKMWGCPPI